MWARISLGLGKAGHTVPEKLTKTMPRARLVALGSGLSCTVLTAEKRLRGWLCLLSGRGQEHVCKVRP